MKPEFAVSWPLELTLDNVKLKKTIKLFIIRFTGTACYNIAQKQLSYKLSCKDNVLNGRFTYDPLDQSIQYRKRLPFPLVGNKLGSFVASARWTHSDLTQTWEPSFRFGVEFRHGSAELVTPNSARIKPRLYLKNVGLEAKTLVTLHLPSKLLFDFAHGHGNGSDGNLSLHHDEDEPTGIGLDVQELNLVIRL